MRRTVAGTGVDPTIQFAKLTLPSGEYKLAYSFNSIAEAERVASCNLLEGLENLGALTALQFRGLFYAALSIAHPGMTIERAGDLIGLDAEERLAVANAIAKAYRLSMPEKKADPPAASAPAES